MSDDPMRGLFGEAPDPFNFEFGLGGLAAYGGGSADAFNRQALTGAIDSAIQQGLQGLPTAASALADQTTEQEYIEGLLSNLDPETEAEIREELSDFLKSQETEDFSTGLENELEQVDMLDPDIAGEGDPSIVTDDPQAQWEEVNKDADFEVILGKALDIFGAYNRDAIKNVVDVVNDRGMSVFDVAQATGNSVEDINQAAAESGAAIENQSMGEPTVVGETPQETTEISGGTLVERVIKQPTDNGETLVLKTGDDTVVTGNEDTTVTEGDITNTPVTPTPRPDPPIVDPEPPRPETPITRVTPTPRQTNITLMQSIINETPITESILFEPQFFDIDNIEQGMFERFLRAAGGRR